MTPSDLGLLLFYSMRYAFGRLTYSVNDVDRLIRENWTAITDRDRASLLADLDRELLIHDERDTVLGNSTQHDIWRHLRDWMVTQ